MNVRPGSGDVVEGRTLTHGVVPLAAGDLGVTVPTVQDLPICLSDQLLQQHVLVVGGIGQGKTNMIRHVLRDVRQMMTESDVAVVFDPKGDYLEYFRRPGDIVVNDPVATTDQDPWNILAEIRASKEDPEETLNEIGHTLFDEAIEHTQQPFFPMAARDLFCALLSMMSKNAGATNATVRQFWDGSGIEDLRKILANNPEGRGLSYYIAQDNAQTQGVLSHVVQLVHEVLVGRFRDPGDFSIREALRQRGGRCIFLEYRVASGKALAPVYKILVDLAIKEALSSRRQGRVFFVIDEFRLLPKLHHLDHGINFGREFGLRFIVGMQNHAQVYAAYEEEAASILSGFNCVFAFRVTDEVTRTFIKGLGGENRRRIAVPNLVAGPPIQQILPGHVVEDYDIWDLRPGQAVCFLPGTEAPFLAPLAIFDGSRATVTR